MLPIDYSAIALCGEQKYEFSLEEPGWRGKQEVLSADTFTLVPREGITEKLPTVSVDLSTPVAEGVARELVYFSRVFGREGVGELFRIYALGWRANVGGRAVSQMMWVYPKGAVLLAENPLYVDELIQKYIDAIERDEGAHLV